MVPHAAPQPGRAGQAAPAGGAMPRGDSEAGAVFAALADPTRRHLVTALAANPGATATGLAAELPISRQAVAKHLATLARAGLVSQSRRGRESLFELDPRPLADAARWLTTVGAEWDTRLGDLQRLLKC
jgi:DNA-binding transcriptional ArsR family regulator